MRSRPAAIRDVLQSVFARMESEKGLSWEEVESSWRGLVGHGAFRHSKPVALKKKVLTVFVDSSAWMQELTLQKRGILKGLKRKFGRDRISEIRFKIGEI